jgi:peptidoglycan/LPS O-acetylase OafA/YrhL
MSRSTCCLSEAEPLLRGGALDALRFLASAFIVIFHFQDWTPTPWLWRNSGLGRGYLATDFFLLLSGFVLARVYGPRLALNGSSATSFLVRRIARVWPAHILILVTFALLVLVAGAAGIELHNQYSWKTWPAHAVLIQSWGLGVTCGWNVQSWTLSALVICYTLFPAFWKLLRYLSPLWSAAFGVGLLIIADRVSALLGKHFFALPASIGVVRALPIFFLGVAIARLSHKLTHPRCAYTVAIGAAVCLVGLQVFGRCDLLSILLIALIVLIAGSYVPRHPSKVWARAADLSFSLYITHYLVGSIWFHMLAGFRIELNSAAVLWASWAGSLVVSVVAAAAFHYLIDSPIQRSLRPWLDSAFAGKRRALLDVHGDHGRDRSPVGRRSAKSGRFAVVASRIRRPQATVK